MASASQNGVLVYTGGLGSLQLAWHNREGIRQASVGEPGIYQELDLSPDERRVALKRYNTATDISELWILEISTGILSRLSSHSSDEPHWAPSGQELVFSTNETGKFDVYRKAIGGSEQTLVYRADTDTLATQWLKDGTVLIVGRTVYQVPVSGGRKPHTLLKTEFSGNAPQVSADGRWVAYYMDESGQLEVYVAAFPSFNQKRQVSNGGGCRPQWRKDGKELFYLSLDGRMMSVDVKGATTIDTSAPKALFQTSIRVDTNNLQYAVSSDGQRFLFGEPINVGSSPISVVLNWDAGLKH
jgi:Tol biopolymer transport system component